MIDKLKQDIEKETLNRLKNLYPEEYKQIKIKLEREVEKHGGILR